MTTDVPARSRPRFWGGFVGALVIGTAVAVLGAADLGLASLLGAGAAALGGVVLSSTPASREVGRGMLAGAIAVVPFVWAAGVVLLLVLL